METYQFTGVHFLASYCGCGTKLTNINNLKLAFIDSINASGATILGDRDHIFTSDQTPPLNGYTCVFVLSESHASIHTYPEVNACFVDLFTCGDHCLHEQFDEKLREYLQPSYVSYQVIKRDTNIKIVEQNVTQL